MTKLIVEMEMPKACRWYEDGTKKKCPIAEWGGACAVTKLFEPFDDNRPSWCPIEGVLPDEHGDLVDRDKLKNNLLCEHAYYYNRTDAAIAVQACIVDVETSKAIIAAERKDDGK